MSNETEEERHIRILRAWGTPTSTWAADRIEASRPTPSAGNDVTEAIDAIEMGLAFAYEQGLHEFGYDPVEVVRAALSID